MLLPLLAYMVSAHVVSRASIERCLTTNLEVSCGDEVERDCLRASVPFRTPYTRVKHCFECCVRHWLRESGLLANIEHHVSKLASDGYGSSKRGPDTADFGRDPASNVLVHTHAFGAISHARMHPYHGCTVTPSARDASFLLGSLYQFDPNTVVKRFHRDGVATGTQAACVHAIRSHWERLVLDVWRQAKYVPDRQVFDRTNLVLANNVANLSGSWCSHPKMFCSNERVDKIIERAIGVRAISVWHAVLEHPRLPSFPKQQRLLLCCCMNVDAKHGSRRSKLALLARFPEFGCATKNLTRRQHLGPPVDDLPRLQIEKDTLQSVRDYKLQPGEVDAHMPMLLLNSKFVFSPAGIAEQCFRDYEAMVAGAYPIVDASTWEPRRTFLAGLPAVVVQDWASVTPAFLEATWQRLESRSFDVRQLYLPYYYDAILSAVGIT